MRFFSTVALAAFSLSIATITQAAVTPLPNFVIPEGDGVDLSGLGDRAQIISAYNYRTAEGHLIIHVFFRDKAGVPRSDFYDTISKRLLFPDQEIALANAHGTALIKSLISPDWVELNSEIFNLRSGNHTVRSSWEGGTLCHWEYRTPWTVENKPNPPYRFSVLMRLSKPQTVTSECARGPYTVHYADIGGQFLGADENGFFALAKAAIIRFDWQGRSGFFRTHPNFVQVPYDQLMAVSAQRSGEDDSDRQADRMYRAQDQLIDSLRGK